MPKEGWTCFHCGEKFTTIGSAQDHFGETPGLGCGCLIKVQAGDERGLLMMLRKVQRELAEAKREIERWMLKVCDAEDDAIKAETKLEQAEQRLAEAMEMLREVKAHCRPVDLACARDEHGNFTLLDERIDAAIAEGKP
jgi:hypothetical protein